MDRDVFAVALETTLADLKDISPRVKSSFFLTKYCAGYGDTQRWVNEMYLTSATPINRNTSLNTSEVIPTALRPLKIIKTLPPREFFT